MHSSSSQSNQGATNYGIYGWLRFSDYCVQIMYCTSRRCSGGRYNTSVSMAVRGTDDPMDTPLLARPEKAPQHCVPTALPLFFDNSVREFFSREEAHTLFRGYFDRFLVAWIDSLTGCALAYLE